MEPEGIRSDSAAMSHHPPGATDFIVPATAGRRVGELAFGAAMGVEALLWLTSPSHVTSYHWFFVPFFTLMSLHFIVRAFDRRPRLAVDAAGITDRTALILGPLHIAWDQVVNISTPRLIGSVEVAVRESREIERRAGPARRVWMFLRRLMGMTTISINPTFLGMQRQELEHRLQAALDSFEHAQVIEARAEAQRIEGGRGGELGRTDSR